uniref:Uncharacterized protein n=1 Tax=Anguilla anguilla TaxID=7936 RepID=A0A0E9RFK6_ANGAN
MSTHKLSQLYQEIFHWRLCNCPPNNKSLPSLLQCSREFLLFPLDLKWQHRYGK